MVAKGSTAEDILALHLRLERLPLPDREYQFAKEIGRKWRFDFAWPVHKIAAEVEGGTWVSGRHSRGGGFVKDCEKYNSANELGWVVYRFTTDMVKAGLAVAQIKRIFPEPER